MLIENALIQSDNVTCRMNCALPMARKNDKMKGYTYVDDTASCRDQLRSYGDTAWI